MLALPLFLADIQQSTTVQTLLDRCVAQPAQERAIVDFFSRQFVAREPFAKSLGLTEADFRPMAQVLVRDAVSAKHCFITTTDTGRIASVLLVRDATRAPSHDLTELCPAAAPIHGLLEAATAQHLEAHPPVVGKTLEGMFMLVDETIENRGTSKTLYLYCFLVCFLQGYREGYACLTNPRSQRLFRSLGGDLVVSLDAAEHFRKLGVSFEGQPGTVAVGVLDLPRALRGLGSLAVRFLGRR